MYDDDVYVDHNENLYDDPLSHGEGLNEDDGVMDSFLIIAITFTIVFLLWWRQRLQQRQIEVDMQRQREEREREGAGNDAVLANGNHDVNVADNGGDGAEGFVAEWAAGGAGMA